MPAGTSVLGCRPFHLCQSVVFRRDSRRSGRRFSVACSEQAAVFHLDLHRVSQEMVAHPQGEKGGEGCTVQRVLPPPNGDPLSGLPQTEQGEDPCLPGRQGEVTIGQGGKYIDLIIEIACGPCLGQVAQGLQVGQGVIQPPTCAAVEVDGGASLGQGVFYGQHGIGVILFCRKGLHGEGLGGRFQGVQVSQQEIWAQPGGLAVAVPPVGGQDKIPWLRRYRQSEKGAGAKEKAGIVDLGHGDVSFP